VKDRNGAGDREDAVHGDGMEVHVGIESAAETLDEGDAAGLRRLDPAFLGGVHVIMGYARSDELMNEAREPPTGSHPSSAEHVGR
jgi:hypothetical protein